MTAHTLPEIPSHVADAYARYPEDIRAFLMTVRAYIFEEAAKNPQVGKITETLKWNEPAYLTDQTKSGTTIRLAWKEKKPEESSLLVNCQSTLVASYKDFYGSVLTFAGSRAVIFQQGQDYPEAAIRHCIAMAQTYHLNKKSSE